MWLIIKNTVISLVGADFCAIEPAAALHINVCNGQYKVHFDSTEHLTAFYQALVAAIKLNRTFVDVQEEGLNWVDVQWDGNVNVDLSDPLDVIVINPLDVNVTNERLRVRVTNKSMDVNIDNEPIDVHVVNELGGVSGSNEPIDVNIVNEPIIVTRSNDW